jgi:hypothetical protein
MTGDPSASITSDSGAEATAVISGIWMDLLLLESVRPDDRFFDVGGTSFTVLELFERLQKAFPQASFSLLDIFDHPTVRAQASLVSR